MAFTQTYYYDTRNPKWRNLTTTLKKYQWRLAFTFILLGQEKIVVSLWNYCFIIIILSNSFLVLNMCSAARLALEILVSTNKPRGPTQSPTSLNLFFDCYGNYDHWDQSLALSHFLLLTTSNSLVHMCLLKFMCHYYFSCGF